MNDLNAQQNLMSILPAPTASRSIGAILVEAGVLTDESVERIARLQREQNLRFGDAAILLGLLTEEQLRFALSKQFNYAYLPAGGGEKPISEELVTAYQPFGAQSEQFRYLRGRLEKRWFNPKAGQNALAVVGCDSGAGCSYFAANLAITFAQLGERTLLIDANMRTPRQHQLFRLNNQHGLSMLLSGRSDQEHTHPVVGFENLSVMTSGPTPPNPQELLSQPVFPALLGALAERFDVILIDTPAMNVCIDAQIVAQAAGGAVAVARKNITPLFLFSSVLSVLKQSGVAVVGTVFNNPVAATASV